MFMYILCNYIHQVDDIRVKMMEFVRSSLRIELQPSCRHQLEWIYIYILKTYPLDIHEHLIKLLDPIKVVSVYLLGGVMMLVTFVIFEYRTPRSGMHHNVSPQLFGLFYKLVNLYVSQLRQLVWSCVCPA